MLGAVVIHWLMILVEVYAGPEVFNCAVQRMASLFCADDILLELMHLEWLQWVFDVLEGIFEWAGLHTNMWNTVDMV